MGAVLHSVRRGPHHSGDMFTARLVCSDAACAEEIDAEAATLAELESLLCDCGCALAVVGWPDAAPSRSRRLAGRQRRAARPRAASRRARLGDRRATVAGGDSAIVGRRVPAGVKPGTGGASSAPGGSGLRSGSLRTTASSVTATPSGGAGSRPGRYQRNGTSA